MHERSLQTGTIEILGIIGGEAPSENWIGGISLQRRVEAGEIDTKVMHEAVRVLAKSYVETTAGARERCVDGRPIEGYDDNDPGHLERPLGPQGAGGTPVQAIAMRISVGEHDDSYLCVDLEQDTVAMAETNKATNYLPGGHIDDHQHPGKTGCGAVDGVEEHAETLGNPDALREIEELTKIVIGNVYTQTDFDHNLASASRLLSVRKTYFKHKARIMDTLRELNPNSTPKLIGGHKEIIVLVNYVKGETLHGDHFSSQFGNNIQAFGYDVWHTQELAEARFPNDPAAQSKYVNARVALTIATLMHLTDGSLLIGTRKAA